MGKLQKMFTCIIILLSIGTSSVHATTFDGHHLATGIDVSYWQEHTHVQHSFRQKHNLETILNHLRLLEYAGMPVSDPESQKARTYRITIHLADGRQHIYHLHADSYLSRDFRPWVKVESSRPFATLLQSLPKEL